MITDTDKEFNTPEYDENGELIEIIQDYDVFKSDDTGLEEKPDNFYKGVENDISELTPNISTVESIINENRDTFNTSRDRLIEIYTSILSKGEISAEDNMNIEESKEQYVSSYNAIKEAVNAKTSKTLEERLEEFKKGFVGASEDEILNILTNNGEKCWLYKDDDNNVLIDSTAIPELTVLVNKLNLIATDGENEGEIKLTPEFISLVVRSTPTQDGVEKISYKYYLSTSDKELVGGSWIDNLPSIAEQQGKYLWFKMVTIYNSDKQPTESDPICMTAQNGQDGKDGEDGADGVDGKDGVSVTDVRNEYSKNKSLLTPPTSGWSTGMPEYQQGYYLWIRTGVKYSDRTDYVYSTPICDPSWKGIDDAFAAINVTKSLIELVVKEGSTQSSIQLTPGVIAAIANSDIKLSAKKILINGLLEGSGWRIDDEGNMDINDLNIRGNITCSSVNVDDLICSNIPTVLNENLDINVTSGMTISETLEDIPLNLNGYTVNIYLKTNSVENIELRRHYAGVIRIFLCGYTVYGYIRGNFNNAIYRIYGGSTDTDTTLGKIMPNTGFRNGSYYYSMVFLNCPNITIENVKVYGDKVNTTNNVCIGASQKSMVDLSNITFVGAKYNVRTYSMGELYCDSSKGTSSGNSWSAGTGSRIVLNAGTQAGGGNNTYTSSNGQIISTGVTFTSTADTSSNTSSSTGTTNRVATYKPKYADTYRSTVYNNWKNDGSCRQGNWGYGNCNGAWFYGSQFSEVVGKTITKVVITVTRASGVGNSGSVSHVFQAHTHTSRPSGMPSYTDCSASLSLAWGQTGSVTITNSTVLNGIKNGTIRGFGIKSSYSSGYYSNLSNGTVKIYYKD